MRDLTADEIREYFEFAQSDRSAGDFHQEQAQLLGEALARSTFMPQVGKKIQSGLAAGFGPEDLFLSLWVMAFQMGRECESRLFTRALKKQKVAR